MPNTPNTPSTLNAPKHNEHNQLLEAKDHKTKQKEKLREAV
jgi:hypothetical protein